MFIFGFQKASENIYKMLTKRRKTSPLESDNMKFMGSYYSFHEDAMRAVFEPLLEKTMY